MKSIVLASLLLCAVSFTTLTAQVPAHLSPGTEGLPSTATRAAGHVTRWQHTAGVPVVSFKVNTFPADVAFPARSAVGDFNGDGIPDLATVSFTNCVVDIALGEGDGTFMPWIVDPSLAIPFFVATGDFNHDGLSDVVVLGGALGDSLVQLSKGNGQLGLGFPLAPSTGATIATTGDFNGDGNLDVVTLVTSVPGMHPAGALYLGRGDGTFDHGKGFGSGLAPVSAVAADFNGDGKLDLAVEFTGDTSHAPILSIFLGNGDGTFQPALHFQSGMRFVAMTVGDVNSDGIPDVVLESRSGHGSETVTVLLGKGDGTFLTPISFDTVLGGIALSLADFNGDGHLDLASLGADGRAGYVAVFAGNGDGTFGAPVKFEIGGHSPVDMNLADFNGDGKPDLVVTNGDSNNLSILLNTTP